jgi:hypothetical protein
MGGPEDVAQAQPSGRDLCISAGYAFRIDHMARQAERMAWQAATRR